MWYDCIEWAPSNAFSVSSSRVPIYCVYVLPHAVRLLPFRLMIKLFKHMKMRCFQMVHNFICGRHQTFFTIIRTNGILKEHFNNFFFFWAQHQRTNLILLNEIQQRQAHWMLFDFRPLIHLNTILVFAFFFFICNCCCCSLFHVIFSNFSFFFLSSFLPLISMSFAWFPFCNQLSNQPTKRRVFFDAIGISSRLNSRCLSFGRDVINLMVLTMNYLPPLRCHLMCMWWVRWHNHLMCCCSCYYCCSCASFMLKT